MNPPPHVSEHNLWNANVPGSTLFMLMATSVSRRLAILAGNGYALYDDLAKRPAGKRARSL